ncbi:MAG: 3-deoxy-manno-octulosonate cytidylyltransferase [Puniceicoccaceae bacterium]|nr:3-deoxy-manno-octulosonate cytidylyltransferase [Puniceicoccaceae bacterium]
MSKLPSIIVPARLGSTRFPRKLLYEIKGVPIVIWTAQRIRSEAPEFPLYFAVDDIELVHCLQSAGFFAILTKQSHSCGTDRIAEANLEVGAAEVINVQGDEPLVHGSQIRALADGLVGEVAVSTLATRFNSPADYNNSSQVKVVRDYLDHALYFSRSPIPSARGIGERIDEKWLAKNPCYRHLGLYAYKSDFLEVFSTLKPGVYEQIEMLEQLRALEHGYKIHVATTDLPTVGIDTLEDVATFEALI